MCQVWFHAFLVKSDQRSQRRTKEIAAFVNFSTTPPPPPPSLVITQVKKSPKITTSSTSPYSYNTSFSPSSPHFRPDFSLLPIVYLPPHLTCRVGYHTSKPRESVVYCLRLVQYGIDVYLTIIPRARMDSKSIGYWLRGNEGSRNNFFSTIQLVGQKRSRQNNFS